MEMCFDLRSSHYIEWINQLIKYKQMRKHQFDPVNEEIMEEAIEKASKLIELLQKQNDELKKNIKNKENYMIERQSCMIERQKRQRKNEEYVVDLKDKLKKYEVKLEKYETQMEEYIKNKIQMQTALKQMQNSLEQMSNTVKDKIKKNKELHQKLSLLTLKIKHLNTTQIQSTNQFNSLQNQNQYLLKKLADYDLKQNKVANQITSKNHQHQLQLQELKRTKIAFGRRCQELKIDNTILIQKLTKESLAHQDILVINKTLVSKLVRLQAMQQEYLKAEAILKKMVEINVGSKASMTVDGNCQQIRNFLGYRLSHIESLCKSIFEKLNKKQWREKLSSLIEVNLAIQRLATYVSQLINKSNN